MCRGGAEQVTLSFHKAFPGAPLFTLCYQPELNFPEFRECDIRTTWMQSLVKTDAAMKRLYFPLGIWAMQSLDLSAYDVVLISSTHCAKYIRARPNALVINYCHTPFRLAWHPESYQQYLQSSGLTKRIFDWIIGQIRRIDFRAAQRTDYYIANTEAIAKRIRRFYQVKQSIEVINPPVNCHNFHLSPAPKSYYLLVSRLEYYKKVDLVVEAFNQLGYPLVIVGKGVQAAAIKTMAKANVTFRSGVSAEELADLYAGCKAFLFPQHEDYGITPLEANASGRPVIAYGEGGVLTTQIPVQGNPTKATALFFKQQTVESLIDAVKQFEAMENHFDSSFIRGHAEQFDERRFIERIRQFVLEKYSLQATSLPA